MQPLPSGALSLSLYLIFFHAFFSFSPFICLFSSWCGFRPRVAPLSCMHKPNENVHKIDKYLLGCLQQQYINVRYSFLFH